MNEASVEHALVSDKLAERQVRGLEAQINALMDRQEQLEALLQLTAGMLLHSIESGEELTRNQKGLVVLGAEHLGIDVVPIDKTQAG